jgi:hypothetical protein
MNEIKAWEARLCSWTPRRPSRKVERRLFGRRPAAGSLPQWLGAVAPAAACLVVSALALAGRDPALMDGIPRDAAMVDMSMSNQVYGAFLAGPSHSAVNHWDTFEWTNGGLSRSSVHSFERLDATNLE